MCLLFLRETEKKYLQKMSFLQGPVYQCHYVSTFVRECREVYSNMLPSAFQVHSGGLPVPPNTCKRKYTGEYLEVTRTSIGGKYFHTVSFFRYHRQISVIFVSTNRSKISSSTPVELNKTIKKI